MAYNRHAYEPYAVTTYYTLKVDDTSLFRVNEKYRTLAAGVLDAGTFSVLGIDSATSRISVSTDDGWVPLAARSITYNTASLVPGNGFTLEAVTLRVGNKVGMDKVPTNRRIGRVT